MTGPLSTVPVTPTNHFGLHVLAATFRLLAHLRATATAAAPAPTPAAATPSEPTTDARIGLDTVLLRHPFLAGYLDEICRFLPERVTWARGAAWWSRHLGMWELGATQHLPLVGLSLPHAERVALVLTGLVEEDSRFGSVLADLQPPLEPRRPTVETLAALIRAGGGPPVDAWTLRQGLLGRGLVEVVQTGGPRSEELLAVPPELWAVLRGGPASLEWAEHLRRDDLLDLDGVLPTPALRDRLGELAGRAPGPTTSVLVRGPRGTGRRRALGALARGWGLGALLVDADVLDAVRWRRLGGVAGALGAVPVVRYDLVPGQRAAVPDPPGLRGPLGLVLGTEGALTGPRAEAAVRLSTSRPGPAERRKHWAASLPHLATADVEDLVGSYLLPPGEIHRVARRAGDLAALARRPPVVADVREAAAGLGRERLDTLAHRLDPPGPGALLVADEATRLQMEGLELRCRHRELADGTLGAAFGRGSGTGVRALLAGPSGTGKTLACRLLAHALGKDLYRLDLSAVVDKYVGETEKNLHRVLSAAEDLDVVLLVDEGDSLLGGRTEVRSANDRFANLETNYLLQRIETYEGIVLVTTNSPDSIDPAFQRRMDVVLTLSDPGPAERWQLWELHLPPGHLVPAAHLDDVAERAELTGGQIRNAALHATLLALDDGSSVGPGHLDRAVAIEYSKAGAVSPFQPATPRRRLAQDFLEALP
jgi:hypothetical protein